jgi:glycosyltransferase involved in cell wall biosynthesis
MKVVLIFRSKKLRYHSIENVFGTLKDELRANDEVETVYVKERGFSIANLLALRKYVATQEPDTIYHVTGDIHYAVFALPRRRSVLTIHDCVFINNRKGLKGWILRKLYLDWPVKYVTALTTISEKTKQEVISLTGCNPAKIKVINNPVSSYIKQSDKPFNCDNPALLFIGALPNKNLNRVIEALKGLKCTLNIIGHPEEQELSRMNEYGIVYTLEENLSNEDMAMRYEHADIILFPSLYEGFGLPVIEGFKAGRAVLTSEISPLKELSDGAAWLVDPYRVESIRNALDKIISDAETRDRKIRAGFEIVRQYSADVVASQYHKVYTDLRLHKLTVLASIVTYLF